MIFSGKIAIVTGAAQGIGKAIAIAFAREGANLVLADANDRKVQETAAEVERIGRKSLCLSMDVTIPRQIKEMVDKAVETFGRIDILVNNAGILRAVPFLNATEEDWDLTLDVNLKGVFLCSQAVAHKMVARKSGRIINVASNAGKVPRVNNAAYCASKAGVILLTKVIALELAKYGITANALCPGATETELLVKTQSGGLSQGLDGIIKGSLETFRAGIPMGRLAKPEEQASMVLFLASEAANHITGQTFIVDGGQTMV
jgi:NAD(P)-dependent dehydrogenase (short-subunit alcohol dehydrogenase family)